MKKPRIFDRLIGYIVTWKRDTQITASWLNVPLIYLTSATLFYQNISILRKTFQSYGTYLAFSIVFFALFYWVMAKLLLRLEIYSAEVIYSQKINPYAYNEFTPKERVIIEMSVLHTEGVIQLALVLCPENNVLIDELKQAKKSVEALLNGEKRK